MVGSNFSGRSDLGDFSIPQITCLKNLNPGSVMGDLFFRDSPLPITKLLTRENGRLVSRPLTNRNEASIL